MNMVRALCVTGLLFAIGLPAHAGGCKVTQWDFAADFVNSEKVLNSPILEDICAKRDAWELLVSPSGSFEPGAFQRMSEPIYAQGESLGTCPPGDYKGWSGPQGNGYVAVNSGADVVCSDAGGIPWPLGTISWPLGTVMTHPGPSDQRPVIAWKSQIQGVVLVSFTLTRCDPTSNGTGVIGLFRKNGETVDSFAVGTAPGSVGTFTKTVSVRHRDQLYFGIGSNGTYNYDSTWIDIVITPQ